MATAIPHEHGPEISETRARQGRFGWPVFWMLIISTALAMIALLGVWAFQWSGLAASNVKSKAPIGSLPTQTMAPRQSPTPSGY